MVFIIDGETVSYNKINKEQFYDMDESDDGEVNITESTELGDSLKELNNDSVDKKTNMSGIDMRARLNNYEITGLLALDALITLKLIPVEILNFTRLKKRMSVSSGGLGREEIIRIVAGKRELDSNASGGMSMMDKMKSMFKPKNGAA